MYAFTRLHSMVQRYEGGSNFKELLIGNYDLYERKREEPMQLTLFDLYGEENQNCEKILKEAIVPCNLKK